jgi:chromate transporter
MRRPPVFPKAFSVTDRSDPPPNVPIATVLSIFFRVGLTAFGGGTTSWVHRELVENRKYMTDEEFLIGLTIAQVLPGANPVNVCLYMGRKLRGGLGCVIAVIGMLTPAFSVTVAIAWLYSIYGDLPLTHVILSALAGVGVAATMSLGLKAARRIGLKAIPILIAVGTFFAVGIMHWPMVPVVFVVVPLSLGVAYFREKHGVRHG